MQKDKPGVSASALTTYGRWRHYQLVTRCVDRDDPILPSQAANPLEFLSVFLKFCCVVPAPRRPVSCIQHVAYPIDATLRPGGEITQFFRIL
jgi:hypothetical protein